jgi:hypothetical protein
VGEHEERESDEREKQEAAVLPADKAVPIITSGREITDAEQPADDSNRENPT